MVREFPRHLPPLDVMLDDLARPLPAVAKGLGVSLRTLQRWRADGAAPRAAMLAIFWATRWGRSEQSTHAHNLAQAHAGQVDCLRRENARLQRELARVVAAGDFGAANRPMFRPLVVPAPLPIDPLAQAGQRADDGRADDGAADQQQALA
jgi:hypothetical protein